MTDRELTGDEAQRALREAMRRMLATRAVTDQTVADPTPAALIAFVRRKQKFARSEKEARLFSALLTVLEGRQTDDDALTRSAGPDVPPAPQHAATDTKGE